jgi:hypothetical protein
VGRPPRGRGKGSSRESNPPCRWDASPAAKVRISGRIGEVVVELVEQVKATRRETEEGDGASSRNGP